MSAALQGIGLLFTEVMGWKLPVKRGKRANRRSSPVNHITEPRVYTHRTTKEIFAEFQNRTDMQADLLVQRYVGKWVKVNDVVRNVSDDTGIISVIVGKKFTPPVVLVFDKSEWQPFLETLAVGDRIRAEGQVTEVDRMVLYLCDCRILPETGAKGGASGSAVVLKRPPRAPSSGKSDA